MRALIVLIVLLIAIPTASARTVDEGPLEVAADAEPTPHCTVGVTSDVCVATWERGNDSDLRDDNVTLTRLGNRVRVSLEMPGDAPREDIVVDTSDLSVSHPANHVINETWISLNNSVPDASKQYILLESKKYNTGDADPPSGLILKVKSPVPIPDPSGGPSHDSISPGIYSWDCSYYFTVQDQSWCSYDSIHPFPQGIAWTPSTDEASEGPADALSCSNLHQGLQNVPQPYCPVTNITQGLAESAAAEWQSQTPNLRVGGSVDSVAVEIKPAHPDPRPHAGPATMFGTGGQRLDLDNGSGNRSPAAVDSASPSAGNSNTHSRDLHDVPPARGGRQIAVNNAMDGSLIREPWGPLATIAAIVSGALLAILLLLYHRTKEPAEILDNPNRLRIYETIRNEPGIRAGTLKQMLGVNYRTISTHLRVLEQAQLVEGFGSPQRRYFLKGASVGVNEKRKVIAISTPAAKAICEYVRQHGETPLSGIAAALEIPLSTASVTVSRLTRNGILRKRRTLQGLYIALASPTERHPDDCPIYSSGWRGEASRSDA